MPHSERCPVCAAELHPVFRMLVLARYDVQYLSCVSCGLVKTEKPYWLAEAYATPISPEDTGVLARNIGNRAMLEPILHRLFGGQGPFLDVSGGHGLLARLLRDVGFDCYTTDPYCENLFAQGFEPGDGFKATALFTFEVMEHLPDPFAFLRETFDRFGCRTLIFSTLTHAGGVPPRDWWYYLPEFGQHVTFFQRRTLALLAARLGVEYVPLGGELHLFTDRKLPWLSRAVLQRHRLRRLYGCVTRWQRQKLSLTWSDHLKAKAHASSSRRR